MKIWFTEIGEPLPVERDVRLLRYGHMTQWLAARGHDVLWWASSFSHAPKKHVATGGTEETLNGVRFHYLDGPGYDRNVSFARLKHQRVTAQNLARALPAELAAHGRPDLMIVPVPTLECGIVLSRFARAHAIPYLVDIRDHWPEDYVRKLPRALQWAGPYLFAREYSKLHEICANAAGITGVTNMQRDYGLRHAKRAETQYDRTIYLGYTHSVTDARALAEARAWWSVQGVREDHTILSFAGTLGMSFNPYPLLEAVRRLNAEGHKLQLIMAGDGPARAEFIDAAKDMNGNALFPGWINAPQIAAMLEMSKIAVAPYIPNTSMSFSNKFFEFMAHGLPILSSGTGESAACIKESGCGLTYDPNDIDGLTQSLRSLVESPETLRQMGAASRHLYDTRFSSAIIHPQAEEYFASLIASSAEQTPKAVTR